MIGKVLVGIITLYLLLGVFSTPISDGIKGWRTLDTTEYKTNVTTGVGVYSANLTPLSSDLFLASTSQLIPPGIVTSNITESPVATSYIEATKVLLISDLADNTTRTLTVHYYAETDDTVMRALGPFLGILIFGGTAFAIVYGVWQGRHRRSSW